MGHSNVSLRGACFLCEVCVLCGLCVKSFPLLLREVRICFHFIDLLGVPFAVPRDEQDKLVPVQLSQRTFHHVIAQPRRVFQKIFRHRPAFHEMLERALRRSEPVGRHQWFRCLRLVCPVGNHHQYRFVRFLHVAPRIPRGSHHDLFRQHAADKVLPCRDVLHHLRHGPAVWRRLEVPLRFRQPVGRVQKIFLWRFQVLQRLVLLRLRYLLCPRCCCTCHQEQRDQHPCQGLGSHFFAPCSSFAWETVSSR